MVSEGTWGLGCSVSVWIICLITVIVTLMSGDAHTSVPAEKETLVFAPPARVLCFGDSLTFGYVHGSPFPYATRLQALCEQAFGVGTVQVLHMGQSGATISEIAGVCLSHRDVFRGVSGRVFGEVPPVLVS